MFRRCRNIYATLDELGKQMYKDVAVKAKDSYGSDGVVFIQCDGKVQVHCVQIVLGKRKIELKKVFH